MLNTRYNRSMIIMNNKTTTAAVTLPRSDAADRPFQAYHIGLIAYSILIILSNVFAVSLYCRHRTIRAHFSNVLLCSLAVSDLFTGLVYLPVLIVIERSDLVKYRWLLTLQRYHFMFGNMCGFSTVFHIIALTLDKYVAVLYPFKRIYLSTKWLYRKILMFIWIAAVCFALIPLFWYFKDVKSESWLKKFRIYGIFQLVIFFGLSLLILAFCYFRMFTKIHNKDRELSLTGRIQRRPERTDRKTTLIFLCFFALFIIGWFPWFLFTLDNNMLYVDRVIKDFLVTLRYAGACLNPAIYAFFKSDYRKAIKSDLAKLCSKSAGEMDLIQLKTTNCTAGMVDRSQDCNLDRD